MAYLNGNCTFLKPSLEIENTVIAERPTASKFLSYSNGDFDFNNDGNGLLVAFLWETVPELPMGTEIKTLIFWIGDEKITIEDLAAQYDVLENANRHIRYDEDIGDVFYKLHFPKGENDFTSYATAGAISEIDVIYYTD